MIKRDIYLNQLIAFRDTKVIKVVSGIRRCGKSTLFRIYQEYLKQQGVDDHHIISFNFEQLEYETLQEYRELHKYVVDAMKDTRKYYVFFDEIKNVQYFQKTIDSLQLRENIDIYITGSNAYLLSSELATFLSGRYIEIKMQPLSFAEYDSATPNIVPITRKYTDYLMNSSFPGALEFK